MPQGQTGTKLLVAMTGKASAAKAAEGDEPVFAYIASLPQPQRDYRRAHRCSGCQDVAGPPACSEVGDGVLRCGRGLVLLVRRLRRPRETDVHTRHGDQAGTACDADRDGQVHTRRRAGIRGRSRRTPSGVVDEAGRRDALRRGEETMTSGQGAVWYSDTRARTGKRRFPQDHARAIPDPPLTREQGCASRSCRARCRHESRERRQLRALYVLTHGQP